VEIIVAALLLTAVASGVVLALAGTLDLSKSRDTKVRMTAAANRMYEHLRSDKDWLDTCRALPANGTTVCNLKAAVGTSKVNDLMKDDVLDVTWTATAKAVGIDNEGDGLGSADTDGNVHDFFKVTIEVGVPSGDQARLGAGRHVAITSMINGSANTDSGSLLVQVCGAANQLDERVEIAGCDAPFSSYEMPPCSDDPACKPYSLLPSVKPGSLTAVTRWVNVQPLHTTLHVRNEETNTVYSTSVAVPTEPGTWRFADLPTGSYHVEAYSVPGWVDWPSHHIPSDQSATVEKGETARALVMLRKPTSSGPFTMHFDREVTTRKLGDATKTFGSGVEPECESPSSWNSTHYSVTEISCNNATGVMTITTDVACGPCHMWSYYRSTGSFEDYAVVHYIEKKSVATPIWDGASQTTTYLTRPEPFGRFAVITDGATKSYDVPEWEKSVSAAPVVMGGWDHPNVDGISKITVSGMPAGLHRGVAKTASSSIDAKGDAWSPPGCTKDYLWVAAGGGIGGGTCTGFKATGDSDECYTTLNSQFSSDYTLRPGCAGIYWPPLGGTVTAPGYLIIKICKYRISWVKNIVNYADVTYSDEPMEAYPDWDGEEAFAADFPVVIGPGHRRKPGSTADVEIRTDLGCESTPSPPHPIACPSLNRWDNCTTAVVLHIPETPGQETASGVTDGNRPNRNHGGMSGASI
jgi:hypothetical protein